MYVTHFQGQSQKSRISNSFLLTCRTLCSGCSQLALELVHVLLDKLLTRLACTHSTWHVAHTGQAAFGDQLTSAYVIAQKVPPAAAPAEPSDVCCCRAAHIATSIWAFGRLNHLPHLSLMQELANQAMLNSGSFTTKVNFGSAYVMSEQMSSVDRMQLCSSEHQSSSCCQTAVPGTLSVRPSVRPSVLSLGGR